MSDLTLMESTHAGRVVTIAESDYLYGVGPPTVRVSAVGHGLRMRAVEWVRLIGTRSCGGSERRPGDPRVVTTVHHRNAAGLARIGLTFAVTFDPTRHGHPVNAEPHKCARIEWFPVGRLPSNTYPLTAACVRAFRDGVPFALSGWSGAPDG